MAAVQDFTPSNIDKILIQELNELSLNDREKTMEEIHGAHAQRVAQKEQPQKIAKALHQMRWELEQINDSNDDSLISRGKRAYEMAVAENPQYVNDDRFLLRFLRAEEHDTHKAVIRMLSFLEFNRTTFGDHTLTRPICQRDLTPRAIQIMNEEGILQVLPFRDNSGRRIAIFLGMGELGSTSPEIERVSIS